jgi:TRAP-type C4-dicarboxylate transport system permease small subunit
MQGLLLYVEKLSKGLAMVSKVVLVFSVLLTVPDVTGRSFGRPILGTYELVAYSSCIIFACALPFTSWMKGHISVDFLLLKLSPLTRKISNLVHKCVGIGLFLILGLSLIALGTTLRSAGETSVLLRLPFYAAVYATGVCFLMVCLILVCDIVKILGGRNG